MISISSGRNMPVGSVLSLVLLDDWLFPPHQRRPGKTRQIEEATQMLLFGVLGSRPVCFTHKS